MRLFVEPPVVSPGGRVLLRIDDPNPQLAGRGLAILQTLDYAHSWTLFATTPRGRGHAVSMGPKGVFFHAPPDCDVAAGVEFVLPDDASPGGYWLLWEVRQPLHLPVPPIPDDAIAEYHPYNSIPTHETTNFVVRLDVADPGSA